MGDSDARSELTPNGRIATSARSVEAAALAGLAHAALFIVARVLMLRIPQPGDPAVSEWYASSGNQRSLIVALNLITIGSIAFVWFVAVIRRRVGERENRFFGTVFLGSALLTVAIWMIGALLLATPAVDAYLFGTEQNTQSVSGWQAAGQAAITIVGPRLEAVFIISTTTVARLSGAFPRSLVVAGYAAGLVLMVAPVPSDMLPRVFSAWEIWVAGALLVRRRQLEQNLREAVPHA
jgi:hypothetical protein